MYPMNCCVQSFKRTSMLSLCKSSITTMNTIAWACFVCWERWSTKYKQAFDWINFDYVASHASAWKTIFIHSKLQKSLPSRLTHNPVIGFLADFTTAIHPCHLRWLWKATAHSCGCILCCCFRNIMFFVCFFFKGQGCWPCAKPPTWRARGSLFVRPLPFDLSGMGGPTRSTRLQPA